MQDTVLQDIVAYLDFLRNKGLSVTLSCLENALTPYWPVLLRYEVHQPALCFYLKAHPKTCTACYKNKNRLKRKTPKEPYYACCYAGVEEFIVPLLCDENVMCYVHVSGYRGSLPQAARLAQRYENRLGSEFAQLYGGLSEQIPAVETVRAAVSPLEYMFRELRRRGLHIQESVSPADLLYRKMLRYLYDHYASGFTVEQLANALNYSPSYLRQVFVTQSGKTITAALNDIRLEQAAMLLRSTSLTITHIAGDCGFCDGNYFSTAFKRKFHVTPKQYRLGEK